MKLIEDREGTLPSKNHGNLGDKIEAVILNEYSEYESWAVKDLEVYVPDD